MSKYTFVIPCFNAEATIEKCVSSVMKQNIDLFEIILIDDGSNDGTLNVIKQLAKRHACIRFFSQSNRGVAATRNFALSQIRTDYFIFLDSDDYIDDDFLKQVEHNISGVDILCFNVRYVDLNGIEIKRTNHEHLSGSGLLVLGYFIDNQKLFCANGMYVFNTNYFTVKHHFKYVENKLHEDYGLIPIVLANADDVVLIDSTIYNYVMTEASITRGQTDLQKYQSSKDIIEHSIHLIDYFKWFSLDLSITEKLLSYLSNTAILSLQNLNYNSKHKLSKLLLDHNVVDYLLEDTLLRKIKKKYLKMKLKYMGGI